MSAQVDLDGQTLREVLLNRLRWEYGQDAPWEELGSLRRLERDVRMWFSDNQAHDDRCESEFITGPMAWSPCGCAERCPCGCTADMHIGEIGCPCALPGEPPCHPRDTPTDDAQGGRADG